MKDIGKLSIKRKNSIKEAVAAIQRGSVGIALVVDDRGKFLATITDGDIRRAILHKIPLDADMEKIFKMRGNTESIVASQDTPREQLLQMMEQHVIRQIPILDCTGKVVELALLNELIEEEHALPLMAVVMAGGRGQRLHPLTAKMPKPMLDIDHSPLLEHIVARLKKSGINRIYVSTNYKADIIKNHFGDGKNFGVDIKYLHEEKPLGTAGGLGLLKKPYQATLVINGDILTELNFHIMYDFHKAHGADLTMGVRIYESEIPFGVVETEDIFVKKVTEKPVQASIVNAGIYILSPKAYQYIPKGKYFNMTDLAEVMIRKEQKVISFPIQEYWIDVGHPEDYTRAKRDMLNGNMKRHLS